MIFGIASSDSKELPAALTALTIFGILPGIAGYIMYSNSRKKITELEYESRERLILTLAEENKGILNPQILAKLTDLSVKQSRNLLDRLVINSSAVSEVNENGYVEYHFETLKRKITR